MPDECKDLRLNLSSVLAGETSLSEAQRWGTALASASSTRSVDLQRALALDALAHVALPVLEDARAAAALMAMNNVYYRFRQLVGKDGYESLRPGLRMNRIAQPATNQLDFELFSLAVSAINGCGACVQAHEAALLAGGISQAQVHDAVRIAAVISAAAQVLELPDLPVADPTPPAVLEC